MATLVANGGAIGIIFRIADRRAYCRNGKILANRGGGWKVVGRVVEGVDPVAHFDKVRKSYDQGLADNPAAARLRTLIQGFPLNRRAFVLTALSALDSDIDGLWSELNDLDLHVSLDDCKELAEAYEAAKAERDARLAKKILKQ